MLSFIKIDWWHSSVYISLDTVKICLAIYKHLFLNIFRLCCNKETRDVIKDTIPGANKLFNTVSILLSTNNSIDVLKSQNIEEKKNIIRISENIVQVPEILEESQLWGFGVCCCNLSSLWVSCLQTMSRNMSKNMLYVKQCFVLSSF